MPAQLTELVAVYNAERMRWDDTVLATVQLPKPAPVAGDDLDSLLLAEPATCTIKGPADVDELKYGHTYRFYGKWDSYTNRRTGQEERQFHFQTFVRATPHGRGGTIRYLMDAPHVGQRTAEILWEKFQGDAVRILRESPDVAAAAVNAGHFTPAKAQQAAEFLESEQSLEGCTIDLIDVLAGRGFPKTTAKRAVQRWGNKAAETIRQCPYRLMAFRGCGFLRTDAMYLDLGLPAGKLKRQALCAWHSLASDTEGHTWYPVGHVEKGLRAKISGAAVAPVAAIKLARRAKLIATRRDSRGILWVAEGRKAAAEFRVAELVAEALAEGAGEWPDVAEIEGLSPHQADKLTEALTGRIAILGGSPGTGKTYAAAGLIKAIIRVHGAASIAAMAPTGKAAVRLSEALNSYGIELRARTIHSTLGVQGSGDSAKDGDSSAWSFAHNERNPLSRQFLIVDETSMVDTSLMASLLAARARGTHVLFVGDINQLPPVGHGAPLRDLIKAGIPYGELTEIRRNSGAIVRACAAIRAGREFETSPRIDLAAEDPANLFVVSAGSSDAQLAKMLAGIQAARADGLDPVWDVQVLTAVNAKSPLGRKALNQRLQAELNPGGEKAGSNPFQVRDKIVCLKNGFFNVDEERDPGEAEADDDGKVFVANGELASVVVAEPKLTIARLSNPTRYVCIPRGNAKASEDGDDAGGGNDDKADTGCNWDLGYALSTHKSQGSEWPVVIVMLDECPGARMVASREWIYTACSRAKRLCLLVGKKATADSMTRRQALSRRKTFLTEQIDEQQKLLEIGELVAC